MKRKETYLSRDFRETAAQRFPAQAKELNAAFDMRLNALLAENPNLFSIGEGFGFFVFFGKQNEGSFPTAVCPKPYQKKDRITKVTTVKVP